MEWKEFKTDPPKHKDLVLCWNGSITIPAIYYNNQSFNGFYHYTTFYSEYSPTIYSKTKLKEKHKIHNILKWRLIDEPDTTNELIKDENS